MAFVHFPDPLVSLKRQPPPLIPKQREYLVRQEAPLVIPRPLTNPLLPPNEEDLPDSTPQALEFVGQMNDFALSFEIT